jgi:hypothetical protein
MTPHISITLNMRVTIERYSELTGLRSWLDYRTRSARCFLPPSQQP